MQRFADVNVAEASDSSLIEQSRLQWRGRARQRLLEASGRERRIERLDPNPAHARVSRQILAGGHEHEAKASRIIVDDTHAIGHFESHMVMYRLSGTVAEEPRQRLASARPLDPERSAHAQMRDQRFPS